MVLASTSSSFSMSALCSTSPTPSISNSVPNLHWQSLFPFPSLFTDMISPTSTHSFSKKQHAWHSLLHAPFHSLSTAKGQLTKAQPPCFRPSSASSPTTPPFLWWSPNFYTIYPSLDAFQLYQDDHKESPLPITGDNMGDMSFSMHNTLSVPLPAMLDNLCQCQAAPCSCPPTPSFLSWQWASSSSPFCWLKNCQQFLRSQLNVHKVGKGSCSSPLTTNLQLPPHSSLLTPNMQLPLPVSSLFIPPFQGRSLEVHTTNPSLDIFQLCQEDQWMPKKLPSPIVVFNTSDTSVSSHDNPSISHPHLSCDPYQLPTSLHPHPSTPPFPKWQGFSLLPTLCRFKSYGGQQLLSPELQ